MLAVLRASGGDTSIAQMLERLQAGRVESSWKAGDKVGRKAAEFAGFNLLLSEHENSEAGFLEVSETLASNAETLQRAPADVMMEVDFAVFVRAAQMGSILLPSALLTLVGGLALPICVSAYPCADEEER